MKRALIGSLLIGALASSASVFAQSSNVAPRTRAEVKAELIAARNSGQLETIHLELSAIAAISNGEGAGCIAYSFCDAGEQRAYQRAIIRHASSTFFSHLAPMRLARHPYAGLFYVRHRVMAARHNVTVTSDISVENKMVLDVTDASRL
ncbi:DUF4148 domain-containing protein [Caballeronia sordidicola]|uniref:DUF4148 domain-containing protein n=1 Tax=Caballeronia sordidicola TaxID=196367 RepID=UPI00117D8B83|nr:DUF4148 domain-containing protein [Caballeronia sordidicola]